MSLAELDRDLTLMRACWALFDHVHGHVSPEMHKGSRGGGRDRDQIARHTLFAETDFAQNVAVRTTLEELDTPEGIAAHRKASCDAIWTFHAKGKTARKWPLRFLIRHTAFHTLDRAWKMEDKILTLNAPTNP